MASRGIPITTLGGYLGAGKTTLLNRLLRDPGGRRLGVVVNDFGSLPVDAELLDGAGTGDLISLPNGCVCCSLGTDLFAALGQLTSLPEPPDQIVIEASGVADPAVAAAWGTSVGFAPGGVVVLAAADMVMRQAHDKYVGREVLRQLVGADLIVLTKTDLCRGADVESVTGWLSERSDAPVVTPDRSGGVHTDIVLGIRPGSAAAPGSASHLHDGYVTWNFQSSKPVPRCSLEAFLDTLPKGLLRLKGFVVGGDPGRHLVVNVVGRSVNVTEIAGDRRSSELVGVGVRGVLDTDALDRAAHRSGLTATA